MYSVRSLRYIGIGLLVVGIISFVLIEYVVTTAQVIVLCPLYDSTAPNAGGCYMAQDAPAVAKMILNNQDLGIALSIIISVSGAAILGLTKFVANSHVTVPAKDCTHGET
ncbi:MAG: hypothetical protein HMLIMOIP_000657 [Candidatus Nitrosomirales archaeon]|jgi:hypothetical protein